MKKHKIKRSHSENLIQAIAYLKTILAKRIAAYKAGNESGGLRVKSFKLEESTDFFTETIATNRANIFEFLTILLADLLAKKRSPGSSETKNACGLSGQSP